MQPSDGRRAFERFYLRGPAALEVIHRKGAIPHADFHSAALGELVGMDLCRKPEGCSGLQNASGILWRKESFIAENIYEISQFRCLWHHSGNSVDIPVVRVAPAYCVRAEECRAHHGRDALPYTAYYPKHLHFIFGIETVSALDLDGSRTGRHYLPYAFH